VLHIVYGPDTFSSRGFVRDLVASLLQDNPTGEGIARVEGKTATPSEVLNACGQVSLFGARPVVIVEGLLARFEPPKRPGRSRTRKRKALSEGEWADFADRLKPAIATAEVIFVDTQLSSGNDLLAALKDCADVHVFPVLSEAEQVRWMTQRAREAGSGIEDAAARQLAAQAQGDLWQLAGEVDKLAAYCSGETITTQAVARMTASTPSANIFRLVDAIVEGRAKDSQHLLEDMWQSGSSAGYILTMVERQLRIVAQALEATGPRGKVTPQGGEFAGLQDWAQRRAVSQGRRLSPHRVRLALDRVTEADRAVKKGTLDEQTALDLLINDLVAVGRRP
jgi:DNA polymerase-3 subunit delta